jgi:hypothetical protein
MMGSGFGLGLGALSSLDAELLLRKMVWNKAIVIFGLDPNLWRQDVYGNRLYFDHYDDRSSAFGWEFDHSPTPSVLGGSNDINNLRPLHWRANASIGGGLSGLRGFGQKL